MIIMKYDPSQRRTQSPRHCRAEIERSDSMIPLKYVRTDRNGTQYFEDWTCPRCGGAGQSDNWINTGKRCWGCGGSGKRPKPVIVKRYTPEHEAKLEARRKARDEKRLADNPPPSQEELLQMAEQARRNVWQNEGFNRDGVGYLHTGETFKNKDAIYRAGGRWNRFFRGYVSPVRVEGLKGVKIAEIHATDFCNPIGYIDIDKALEYIEAKH